MNTAEIKRILRSPDFNAVLDEMYGDLTRQLRDCPASNPERLLTVKRQLEALDAIVHTLHNYGDGDATS